MDEIRVPRQKRSIETKEKIVKSGLELFLTKGYYNTNTAEIAKNAGVSTGIVYSYFKDKKNILMEVMDKFFESLLFPVLNKIDDLKRCSIKEFIINYLDGAIVGHLKLSKKVHQEIEALQYVDEEIEVCFEKITERMIEKVTKLLIELGFSSENIHEKLHIAFPILEHVTHELSYHNDDNCINKDVFINYTADIIEHLFSK